MFKSIVFSNFVIYTDCTVCYPDAFVFIVETLGFIDRDNAICPADPGSCEIVFAVVDCTARLGPGDKL